MDLIDIAAALNIPYHGERIAISGFNNDSRFIQPGHLFFAMLGEQADGHEFVIHAKQNGAVAAIVERAVEADIPQLVVKNSLQALIQLAQWHRSKFNLPIVALTGSYGKTTTREMIAAILRLQGNTFSSQRNLNSITGVPLSVLELKAEHEYAVFELGANFVGEIAQNSELVRPHVALLIVAEAAHLAGFGNTIDKVAEVKAEIFEGLAEGGTAILNADSPYLNYWRECLQSRYREITFGIQAPADVHGKILKIDAESCLEVAIHTPLGKITTKLSLPGEHQLHNALAATAAVLGIGINDLTLIARGLQQVQPVKGRLVKRKGIKGSIIYDDTYNAAPGAVKAGLKFLSLFSGKRIAVLGDMKELGDHTEFYHQEVGQVAASLPIEQLYTFGESSQIISDLFPGQSQHFTTIEALAEHIAPELDERTAILIKGGRSMRLERLVEKLLDE